MAILQSTDITLRTPIPGFGAGGGQVRRQLAVVTIPAATATSDTIQFFNLPPNSVVIDGWLKVDDLDTGTTVTINVGDAASGTRYFSAVSGQAAAVTRMTAPGGFNFTNVFKTLVTGALQAGPTTTAGTITLCLYYTCEEPA